MRDKVREFWENRSRLVSEEEIGLWQSTSLTSSEGRAIQRRSLELRYVDKALNEIANTNKMNLLDIGCGTGRLTTHLARRFNHVYATDYMDSFLSIATQQCQKEQINNITFARFNSYEVDPSWSFDCCSICGVLLCLDDEDYFKTLRTASRAKHLIIKESVGVDDRFELCGHYSTALESEYNAIYRHKDEIIQDVEKMGYSVVMDELVQSHRKETNLRIFVFKK